MGGEAGPVLLEEECHRYRRGGHGSEKDAFLDADQATKDEDNDADNDNDNADDSVAAMTMDPPT